MKVFESVLDVAQNYDGFILDVWGVLHASGKMFPSVKASLSSLNKMGKKVLLLSNAPRRSAFVAAFLKDVVGILPNIDYSQIITSGEAFFSKMQHAEARAVFYIGPEKDLTVFEGLNVRVTQNINDNFEIAVITGTVNDGSKVIEALRQKNKPLFCLNPDIFITKSDGTVEACAGLLAREYRELGGEVVYFGKPYKEVYEIAMKFFEGIAKSRILAVGDGMETDILGANNFGLSSALCLSGLPSLFLQNGGSLEGFLQENQFAKPNFLIKAL